MKAALEKMTRAGRTTALLVVVVTIVALTAGVADVALAKKEGESSTLELGVENAVTALTSMVGTLTDPILRLDNNGTGPALDLQVEAGSAPLTVNPEAGKATNLDADKLDGKDSTDFLAADGEVQNAANADLLDGKDSTEFLAANGKAADSDKLDGKDSTDFAGSPIFAQISSTGSLVSSNSSHAVSSGRAGTGIYEVTFDRAVDVGCIHLAQSLDPQPTFTTTTAGPRFLPPLVPQRERRVRVDQFDQAGTRVDGSVVVNVVCK